MTHLTKYTRYTIALILAGAAMSAMHGCGGEDTPAKPAYCSPDFTGPLTAEQQAECKK